MSSSNKNANGYLNIKTCHICGRKLYKRRTNNVLNQHKRGFEKGHFMLTCYNTKHNFVIFQDFNKKLKFNVSNIKIRIKIDNKEFFAVFRFFEQLKPKLEIKDVKNYNTILSIDNFDYIENIFVLQNKLKKLMNFI